MVDNLGSVPLMYEPGEDWHYSFATEVLARLIEAASGQSFDAFLAARIFEPLDMKDTGFHVPLRKRDRFAVVYGNGLKAADAPQPGTTGTPIEKRNPESTNYMNVRPSGRDEALLYATSKDGIHWEKPELGIVEFQGSKKNNIVCRGLSGASVLCGCTTKFQLSEIERSAVPRVPTR